MTDLTEPQRRVLSEILDHGGGLHVDLDEGELYCADGFRPQQGVARRLIAKLGISATAGMFGVGQSYDLRGAPDR